MFNKESEKPYSNHLVFKKDDIVYVLDNSWWGLKPMTVVDVIPTSGIACRHPDANGVNLWFSPRYLKLVSDVSPEYLAQIRELSDLQDKVKTMKEEIFGKGN